MDPGKPFRVQLAPAEPVPSQRLAPFWVGQIVGPFAVSGPAMVGLDILASHGVPVPALGYWDTLLVLAAAQALLIQLRRARWYG